ncbi:MAG: hypothetical protein KJT03_17315 [Verrucomicrobiae bacterium]|nr:hypothetical protein [Verrucomicrobiae bacterium]
MGIKSENTVIFFFRWLHFLALDAVAVGLVWQELFFRHAAIPIQWKYQLILAGAIWLAYMADRLFDNLSLDPLKPTTRRHAFIRSHWKKIAVVWIVVLVSSVAFSILQLNFTELMGGLLIVVLINLYFLILKISRKVPLLGSLKEILTATLFSIGVSYFPVMSLSESFFNLLYEQVIFGLLCFANILLISHWEHEIDALQEEAKLSQRSLNRENLLKLVLVSLGFWSIFQVTTQHEIFSWALLISSLAMWLLFLEARLRGSRQLKFLIDVPLMLPVIVLFL